MRRATFVAVLGLALLAVSPAGGGNLGERIVRGRVYNLDRGEAVPIASATVSYRNLNDTGSGASGLAVTDVNGMFAFPIVLQRDDVVRLTASAPGFEPFTTSARADTLVGRAPAIEMGLGAPNPGRHRVRGQLRDGRNCATDAGGVQVRLRRTGQTARTTSTGAFHFDGIENGEYVLRVGRLDLELPVTVDGRDEEVRLCLDCPDLPTLLPSRGRAGTLLHVASDGCSALAPGTEILVYLEDRLIASSQSTAPSWSVSFRIPTDTPAGPQRVRIHTRAAGEIASAQFVVEPLCPGDCDANGAVSIAEILRGVALALGTSGEPCPAFSEAVTISELIAAVDRALRGCDVQNG